MEKTLFKTIASKVFYFGWSLWARMLSDEAYVKWQHKKYYHEKLDLKHPLTFQEKLQWIKLYDRKPIYHQMVDKYGAKEFISEKFGPEYCVPTIGVFNNFDEIDFDKFPNQFILKGTFDSCSYYICRDKNQFNVKDARRVLYTHWNYDFYLWNREWPYKGLKHRIIAEPLIGTPENIYEYKFFCFNGEPKIYQTCYDRKKRGGAVLRFYDIEGKLIDIDDKHHSRTTDVELPSPKNFETMLKICRQASKDTFFLRVDFYEVEGKLYLGEFTFFENGGFCEFKPEKYNRILGDWIKLPTDK